MGGVFGLRGCGSVDGCPLPAAARSRSGMTWYLFFHLQSNPDATLRTYPSPNHYQTVSVVPTSILPSFDISSPAFGVTRTDVSPMVTRCQGAAT
jgi:hypothetical protein